LHTNLQNFLKGNFSGLTARYLKDTLII
jgi:hypothetical protein